MCVYMTLWGHVTKFTLIMGWSAGKLASVLADEIVSDRCTVSDWYMRPMVGVETAGATSMYRAKLVLSCPWS